MMKNVARDKKREKQNHLFLIKKKIKNSKREVIRVEMGRITPRLMVIEVG